MSFYINYPSWLSPFVFPFTTVIRWYSLMYIFAFVTAYLLLHHIVKMNQTRLELSVKKNEDVDLVVYTAIFLVLGARLGSCLIYSGSFYYKHPWLIFWPFENGHFVGLPGMSYHGGVLGAVFGVWLFTHLKKRKFLEATDTLVCCIPLAYTWGRLGNFFNAELYGRVTASCFGMMFPSSSTESFSTSIPWVQEIMKKIGLTTTASFVNLPRFPSQIYEAFFEGVVVGLIMWLIIRPRLKTITRGIATGLYLSLYGIVRFFIEYFREPDSNLGFIIKGGKGADIPNLFTSILNISMGQILCFVMILIGVGLIIFCKKRYKNDISVKEGKNGRH